jgi:hypothetical protein
VSVVDLGKKLFWSDGAEQITGYARIDVPITACANSTTRSNNRRISLIVQYVVKDDDEDDAKTPATAGDKKVSKNSLPAPADTSDKKK